LITLAIVERFLIPKSRLCFCKISCLPTMMLGWCWQYYLLHGGEIGICSDAPVCENLGGQLTLFERRPPRPRPSRPTGTPARPSLRGPTVPPSQTRRCPYRWCRCPLLKASYQPPPLCTHPIPLGGCLRLGGACVASTPQAQAGCLGLSHVTFCPLSPSIFLSHASTVGGAWGRRMAQKGALARGGRGSKPRRENPQQKIFHVSNDANFHGFFSLSDSNIFFLVLLNLPLHRNMSQRILVFANFLPLFDGPGIWLKGMVNDMGLFMH